MNSIKVGDEVMVRGFPPSVNVGKVTDHYSIGNIDNFRVKLTNFKYAPVERDYHSFKLDDLRKLTKLEKALQ